MMWDNFPGMGTIGIGFFIFQLINLGILIGFIWLIVWGVKELAKRNKVNSETNTMNQSTALEILKQRYTKGEISKEEFERMKKDLE